MDFSGLFETQIALFLIMLLGMFLRKKGMIPSDGKAILSDLVINVTLPCSIIRSFQIEFNHQILMRTLEMLIVATLIQISCYFLGMIAYPGRREERKNVLKYATICSNVGVLGNPIAEGIFGGIGPLYASIYVIPQRMFMWSVGLTFFTDAPDMKSLLKKLATHPCILAVVIGFGLMVSQISIPGFAESTLDAVADANTFLAMLLVGALLGEVKPSTMFDKDTLYYSLVRLILIPMLVLIGCRLGHVDTLVTEV